VKRLAGLSLLILSFVFAATAAADTGTWGKWEPTFQGPISVPAGAVCSFPVTAEPVREDLRIRYHFDEAGNPDGYQVVGSLIARITNTATGVSVVRNLSGHGTVMFQPDGSWDADVEGGFLVFFRSADQPANQLLYFDGRTLLHGLPTGEKALVGSAGHTENLCETLA
jgi:hypothetical protein